MSLYYTYQRFGAIGRMCMSNHNSTWQCASLDNVSLSSVSLSPLSDETQMTFYYEARIIYVGPVAQSV